MRRGYWFAFAACAAAATIPLLMTGILPMVDLPEHAAELAIWAHFDDPCHRFFEKFALNLATPYLFGYAVARLLSIFLGVATAVKVTVWLYIMLVPMALHVLIKRGDGDPWWSLIGFPLAYGYAFYYGFFNFLISIPIAFFYTALLFDRGPRTVARTATAVVLLSGHALMFLFCAAVTIAVAIARRSWRLLVPLLLPGALLSVWAVGLGGTHYEQIWTSVSFRFFHFPSHLFSIDWEPAALPLCVGIALAVGIARPHVTRDLSRWAFVAVAAVAYFLAPSSVIGFNCLYQRYALMLAVALLFVFERPRGWIRVSRAIVLVLVFSWMAILSVRFQKFGADVRDFDRLVEAMPANRRVILFDGSLFSDDVPGPVFSHFAAWYQTRKGGMTAASFARQYPQLVRYREGAGPPVLNEALLRIRAVDWLAALQFDYIILRASHERTMLLGDAPAPITLRGREGMWWLYETPRARTPQRNCSPIEAR